MREAGLASVPAGRREAEPLDPKPRYEGPSLLGGAPLFDNPAFTGNARARRWDAVVTAEPPDVAGPEGALRSLPRTAPPRAWTSGTATLDPPPPPHRAQHPPH